MMPRRYQTHTVPTAGPGDEESLTLQHGYLNDTRLLRGRCGDLEGDRNQSPSSSAPAVIEYYSVPLDPFQQL